jgi:flagellar protein FlgJ
MAILPNSYVEGLAIDAQNLDGLKLKAKTAPDQALQQAAKQFEAVFLNMMMKSMREASSATQQDGLFDSNETRTYTSMLDQQLAQSMSGHGMGLAEMMVKQLSHQMASPVAGKPANMAVPQMPASQGMHASASAAASAPRAVPSAYNENAQQGFVRQMLPAAMQASQQTGIPAQMMIGQAALESGWGKREIQMPDGGNSYNLFGIKAGANWKGKVAEVMTTEYHNGVATKQVEKFRAYNSYAEAFSDYANLLTGSSRYAGVLQQGADINGFAQAMQQSGYATDPAYADKLAQTIRRVSMLG